MEAMDHIRTLTESFDDDWCVVLGQHHALPLHIATCPSTGVGVTSQPAYFLLRLHG